MDAFIESRKLFNVRVLKYIEDNLFITDYSKDLSKSLHEGAVKNIKLWEQLYLYKIDVEIM